MILTCEMCERELITLGDDQPNLVRPVCRHERMNTDGQCRDCGTYPYLSQGGSRAGT